MFASVDVGDVVGRPNRLDPNSVVFLHLGSQEILGLSGELVFPLITDKILPCHLLKRVGGARGLQPGTAGCGATQGRVLQQSENEAWDTDSGDFSPTIIILPSSSSSRPESLGLGYYD